MKEIVSHSHINQEINSLVEIANSRITNLELTVLKKEDYSTKSIITERVKLKTLESEYYFYSTASPQHWYGDGEVEILTKPYPDDNDDFNLNEYVNVDLITIPNWIKLFDSKISGIKIYSAGKKAFQLLRFRNEMTFNQATYIEFTTEQNSCFSIGFHGNNKEESKDMFLNYYSWSGELIMNYGHRLTEDELIKWSLKEIFKKSW